MFLILQVDISLFVSPWISASNPFILHLSHVCYSTVLDPCCAIYEGWL